MKSMKRNFTLVELLVVIAIIMILAGLLFSAVGAMRTRAQKENTKALLLKISTALERYKGDMGHYPYTNTGTTSYACKLSSGETWTEREWMIKNGRFLYDRLIPYDATDKTGGYLKKDSEISKSNYDPTAKGVTFTPALAGSPERFLDIFGCTIVYIFTDASDARLPIGTYPEVPDAIIGFKKTYELWSLGPDRKYNNFHKNDGGTYDKDNITVTEYGGGM